MLPLEKGSDFIIPFLIVRCQAPKKQKDAQKGVRNCRKDLSHCVQLFGKLALLASSSILVHDTTKHSLVDLLDSGLVGFLSKLDIACGDCSLVLLHFGLQLGAEHFVLQSLHRSNLNTLFCTLDIRQILHPPLNFVRFARRRLRGCAVAIVHTLMYFNIPDGKMQGLFQKKSKYFFAKWKKLSKNFKKALDKQVELCYNIKLHYNCKLCPFLGNLQDFIPIYL